MLRQHANKGRNAKQVVLKQHANKRLYAKLTDINGNRTLEPVRNSSKKMEGTHLGEALTKEVQDPSEERLRDLARKLGAAKKEIMAMSRSLMRKKTDQEPEQDINSKGLTVRELIPETGSAQPSPSPTPAGQPHPAPGSRDTGRAHPGSSPMPIPTLLPPTHATTSQRPGAVNSPQ